MSFEAPTLGRVIRQHIYTPLELAILAGLVALYCRRDESGRRQLPWAAVLGLAFGCFWLTREESVWLVPSIVLLVAAGLYGAYDISRAQGRTQLTSLGVAAACALHEEQELRAHIGAAFVAGEDRHVGASVARGVERVRTVRGIEFALAIDRNRQREGEARRRREAAVGGLRPDVELRDALRDLINQAAEFATHDPEPDVAELYTDIYR